MKTQRLSGLLFAALLAFLPLASGCTLTGPGSPRNLTELDDARRAWESRGLDDYDMEMVRGCFCVGAGSMTVFVRGDSVAAIRQEESYWDRHTDWWQYIPTVDELFDLIEDATTNAYAVEVTYDQTHGFPVSVSIDWIKDAVDDEISYSVTRIDAAPDNEVVTLGFGDEASLDSGHLVAFSRLVEESRCALNTQCIWAGRVRVAVTIRAANGSESEVTLTHGELNEGESASGSALGVDLSLIGVSPYPADAGNPTPEESYVIYLVAQAD